MIIKPMLAGTVKDESKIRFPVLASPKLDGFRCLKINGKALSRSLKPIANNYVRETLENSDDFISGLDGELMLSDPNATFNSISSAFRKYDGKPDFVFFAFDLVSDSLEEPFLERITRLRAWVDSCNSDLIKIVPQVLIENHEQLAEYEAECLAEGYEGVMIRDPEGPYKCGRSTAREGYLMKIKRFEDAEAEVIGLTEQMHNENEQTKNELGLSSRSTKKEGMVPAGTLGTFVVRDLKTGVEFEIGTGDGLTQELRKEIWNNQDKYIGQIVKYKHQPVGQHEKPRFPVWLGFRAPEDMS